MDLFDLKYYIFELDYIKYIIYFLVLNWFFQNYFVIDISLNTIVRFLMIGLILYFVFIFNLKNKKEIGKKINDKIEIIKAPNLLHIYEDVDAILLYSSILDLRDVNKYSFNKSMKHYDNFIKIKNNILKNSVKYPKNYYTILENEMNKSINALVSIGVGIPPSGNSNDNDIKLKKLETFSKKLYKIFYNHIDDVNNFLQKKWKNEEKNIDSFPVHISNIKPNMTKTKEYSKNYSIF